MIERMTAYEAQWGGWLLPPAPRYEGGPKVFRSDVPEADGAGNWWFDAGDPRVSTWYGFMIGPESEFCIDDRANRVILHSSIEGWVESVALAYQVRYWAPQSVTVRGAAVDEIDLSDMEEFVEVAGVSDGWWRKADTVVAVYRGEAWLLGSPEEQIAIIYSGITEPEIYLDY
ncbi:hypothetical protein [Micromonospora craterilacus]|nr:hypothetical protein [Micromonospora craterilacus]